MPQLWGKGAHELAGLIRSRRVSAAEVVEEHIRRIEAVNGELNAVVIPLFDQARTEARAADEALARGVEPGPLHGVPVTIKECHYVAGTCATAGLECRAGTCETTDALMVERLREAGAIVLGKTNVPQLMLYFETDNPVYGRTNNPWNPERTPGGSTGGEGAILAAGGSALGLGSDIGGSIRVPAHFCGISGLKPTSGRLSVMGSADQLLFPGMEGILDQPGPLARNVADLNLAMRVLAAPGQAERDPAVPPVPWQEPGEVSIRGLRVGFYTFDGFLPASPAIRRAVTEAARALEGMGAYVTEFQPPSAAEVAGLFTGMLTAGGVDWARELLRTGRTDKRLSTLILSSRLPAPVRAVAASVMGAAGQPHLAASLRATGARTAREYWDLVAARNAFRDRYLGAMASQRLDVVLCPPFLTPALPHGASEWLNAIATYPQVFNVLGLPAGVVAATRVRPGEESDRPASRSMPEKVAAQVEQGSAGLPVGVQVAARHWREDLVLAVMGALESHFRGLEGYPQL